MLLMMCWTGGGGGRVRRGGCRFERTEARRVVVDAGAGAGAGAVGVVVGENPWWTWCMRRRTFCGVGVLSRFQLYRMYGSLLSYDSDGLVSEKCC